MSEILLWKHRRPAATNIVAAFRYQQLLLIQFQLTCRLINLIRKLSIKILNLGFFLHVLLSFIEHHLISCILVENHAITVKKTLEIRDLPHLDWSPYVKTIHPVGQRWTWFAAWCWFIILTYVILSIFILLELIKKHTSLARFR